MAAAPPGSVMSERDPELEALVGATVGGRYHVEALLGRGGMGAVFAATNVAIQKRVALKFLTREAARDADAVTRFQREAEAASSVESAHIVEIFDSGRTDDGLPFLVMELLRGEDLRARLRREGRLPLAEVVHIAGQVARALRGAHAAGIVHRDLKPDNVYLCDRDDDPMFVKIVDFGISKVARHGATADTLTHQGVVLGTAFYMSPEQAQAFRDIDGRTDIFSLGAIMYEALAGRPPHVGHAYEAVLIDICTRDAPDVRQYAPNVPEPMAQVLTRALARDRTARFQSAVELYDALALAAPGLLKSGGPGGSGRHHATRWSGQEAMGAASGVATAEGTAVAPVSLGPSKGRLGRLALVALLAALVGFALTVLVVKPEDEAPLPPPVPVAAAPLTSSTSAPVLSAVAPASATSSSMPVAGALPPRPHDAPKAPVASTSAKSRPKTGRPGTSPAATEPKPRDTGGVAKGLRLVTEP